MNFRKRFWIYLSTLIPPGIVLFLYGYIGSFNRLIADSFCSFYYAKKLGLLRSIWYWRLNWSGRYSAYAFDWLVEKIFRNNITAITAIALIAWVFAFIIFIHTLIGKAPYNSNEIYLPIILGPLVVFAILTNGPDTQQAFLWLDGFRAYSLPIILLTFYAACLFHITKNLETKRQLFYASVITFFFCFAIGGLSETFAVFQIGLFTYSFFGYLIVKNTFKLDKNSIIVLVALTASVISLLIIITAPGNKIRQSFLPPPLGIFEILRIALLGYWSFFKELLITPEKTMGLFGVTLLFMWAGSVHVKELKNCKLLILLQVFAGFILSFICFPPSVYGYGESPPGRVIIIPLFIMCTLFFSASFMIGNFFQNHTTKATYFKSLILPAAISLIAASSSVHAISLYTSRINYIEFAENWDTVDFLISNAKTDGQKIVHIPAVPNWARLDRPNDNPKHWMTKCYSDFYDVQILAPPY